MALTSAAYDAIIDMTRYGGALLAWDGEEMRAYDPLSWYPMVDADLFSFAPSPARSRRTPTTIRCEHPLRTARGPRHLYDLQLDKLAR